MNSDDQIDVRPAAMGDAGQVAVLMRELGYSSVTTRDVEDRMNFVSNDDSYETLVAVRDGVVLGVVDVHSWRLFERDERQVQVIGIVVSPDVRGAGIGSALMSAAESWAAQHGATSMGLVTGFSRDEAHEFYENRGWSRNGFRFMRPAP